MQIGIDLIGHLPQLPLGNKYMVTLVDYFSKWPEAASLPDKTVQGVAIFYLSFSSGVLPESVIIHNMHACTLRLLTMNNSP